MAPFLVLRVPSVHFVLVSPGRAHLSGRPNEGSSASMQAEIPVVCSPISLNLFIKKRQKTNRMSVSLAWNLKLQSHMEAGSIS